VASTLFWRSAPTSWDEVCKRNAGRRHYNRVRALRRAFRRKQVADLLCRYGMIDRGVRARIARELGVHRSVITRDVQFLRATANTARRSGSVPRDTTAS
jgi:hypothetical protein